MLTFEQFLDFEKEHNFFPNGLYHKAKQYNDRELRRKYEDYKRSELKKQERREQQIQRQKEKNLEKMENPENYISDHKRKVYEAQEAVRKENPNGEYFWSRLSSCEEDFIRNEMKKIPDFSKYDPCHVISQGKCKRLAYEKKNIVIAPRAFHTYIDSMMNPFTEEHEFLSRKEWENIWIKIVGKERWNWLNEQYRSG